MRPAYRGTTAIMQLLRNVEPETVPAQISFACPNGCRNPAQPAESARVMVSVTTLDQPGDENLLLGFQRPVRCPVCGEYCSDGLVSEALQRELGSLLR